MNRYLTYRLRNGHEYKAKWHTPRMVHDAAYKEKIFLHTKKWNQILQLPGPEEKSEKEARDVAAEVLEVFWYKLFHHLCTTDDIFIMPMNLFHLKVVPAKKKNCFKFTMIPTENGLIHTKFIPWYIKVSKRATKYLFKNQYAGRIWSNYEIDVDLDKALKRRGNANAKKRVNRLKKKYGIQQPICNPQGNS